MNWQCKLASVSKLTFHAFIISSDEGLTIETSALKLFTVANRCYHLSWWYPIRYSPTDATPPFLRILSPFIHMARKILFTIKTTLLEHFVCLSKLSISINFNYPGTNSFPKQRRRIWKKFGRVEWMLEEIIIVNWNCATTLLDLLFNQVCIKDRKKPQKFLQVWAYFPLRVGKQLYFIFPPLSFIKFKDTIFHLDGFRFSGLSGCVL